MDLKLVNNSQLSFTASANVYSKITTAYIKDCPNTSGIDLLRNSTNLQRIRCDVGNVSGSVAELLRYAALAGFTDDYQEQQTPRIIGTWTLNNWYTNEELENFQGAIDGLTVLGDGIHNVDTALENGDFAIQTLDSTKDGYNPAAAIILNNNNLGFVTQLPINSNEGRYFITKSDAGTLTTLNSYFKNARTLTDDNSIVSSDNTVQYNFETFNEFVFFSNIKTLNISNTNFIGANKLTSIKISPLNSCSLGAFYGCTVLNNLTITMSSSNKVEAMSVNDSGYSFYPSGTGTLHINGNVAGGSAGLPGFKYVEINGSVSSTTAGRNIINRATTYISSLRVKNNVTLGATSGSNISLYFCYNSHGGTSKVEFVEFNDFIFNNVTSSLRKMFYANSGYSISSNVKLHCCKSSLITITSTEACLSYSRVKKFYVGDGSSKAADEAVFALYNADTDWSAYCGNGVPGDGKVDLWWNYNGEYKWYYITDNLTNCINTNPDAWPHITRGESYETVLVPDEGYSLQNSHVTIEMLDTDTTSSTYDTMVDITAECTLGYFPGTGEVVIQIPSVTGNVVITVSANQL